MRDAAIDSIAVIGANLLLVYYFTFIYTGKSIKNNEVNNSFNHSVIPATVIHSTGPDCASSENYLTWIPFRLRRLEVKSPTVT
jgi:hypothetical protein